MSEAVQQTFGLEAFLAWEREQERRYELVDGVAVMMTGGTQGHALIAANIVAALRPRLRGSPCRPSGSDMRVPIPATGNARYPDVTVDCGPFDRSSHDASRPTVVFEVLSDSTGWFDQTRKLRDYDSVASIRQYVCVSQSEPRVLVWRRDGSGRLVPDAILVKGALQLDFEGLMADLSLADIYEETGLLDASAAG
ncbi:Uma2 family endonuclease [Aureimonas jatrophae]|uniref:Endonuclease, Uma2 family (Restriction endonuclease fold) n=1 Tax=Aureimonas jatrophae TaxID=1166073 RepID=A0A1H0LI71_9HYPH|nr:Uma2 family endonuclease [Aureimonas jatrophae]MBB3952524.1 Uma2 family endonuclease [Aureimonas jatrophae]SDO67721.1 Endonuclease, Uma2 family (restriction endonuclease fold) [Aureimonas jatrophae]